jgi:hypothetical protein
MSGATAPNPQADAERLEAAADQAIAACGGDAREAMKALLVANEFLENESATQVSREYTRGVKHGRFNTYPTLLCRCPRLNLTRNLPACLCVLEGRFTKSRSIEWLRKQRRLLCVANTRRLM